MLLTDYFCGKIFITNFVAGFTKDINITNTLYYSYYFKFIKR